MSICEIFGAGFNHFLPKLGDIYQKHQIILNILFSVPFLDFFWKYIIPNILFSSLDLKKIWILFRVNLPDFWCRFQPFCTKTWRLFLKASNYLKYSFFISISRFFLEIHYSKYSFFISRFEKHPNIISGSFRDFPPSFGHFADFFSKN